MPEQLPPPFCPPSKPRCTSSCTPQLIALTVCLQTPTSGPTSLHFRTQCRNQPRLGSLACAAVLRRAAAQKWALAQHLVRIGEAATSGCGLTRILHAIQGQQAPQLMVPSVPGARAAASTAAGLHALLF